MEPLFTEEKQPAAARLDSIERKIGRLIHEARQLREENRQLLDERKQLKATIDRQRDEVRHFQEQIKSSIVVSTIAAGQGEAGALRYRIDEYVKEIEKCITHLSD